jgi:hypothetical protein
MLADRSIPIHDGPVGEAEYRLIPASIQEASNSVSL